MTKFLILTILAVFHTNIFAQENNLHSLAVLATKQKHQQFVMEETWRGGFTHAMNEALATQPSDQQLTDLYKYLELSHRNRTSLQIRIPKLNHLLKLLDPDKILARKKETDLLLTKIHKTIQSNPETLKELIRTYHLKEEEIDSDMLDLFLGINYDENEKNIFQKGYRDEIGAGWRKFTTQTYYEEVKEMFKHHPPKTGDVVYDFGSGYGRVLFYGAALFPAINFKGIEIVPERVKATQLIADQKKFNNVSFINQDILDADYQNGTYFYLFNPFPKIMNQVMSELHKIALKRKIIIVATGRSTEDLDQIKWLKVIKVYKTKRFLTAYESK